MLLTACAIRASDGGPILFVQERAGLSGKLFRLFKFRTMVADAEKRLPDVVCLDDLATPMFKLRHDPRITRVGGLLRRTSFDELPQLINVLLGDMSLVGPRPEQVELVARYRDEELFRLSVKPGADRPNAGVRPRAFDIRRAARRRAHIHRELHDLPGRPSPRDDRLGGSQRTRRVLIARRAAALRTPVLRDSNSAKAMRAVSRSSITRA